MNEEVFAGWDSSRERIEHAIRSYFREQGRDPESAAVESTIATNTELVPRRASNLRRALLELSDLDTTRGLDVVEVGCGFGALAAYIAMSWQPRSIHAVDIRADFTASAQDLARALRLEALLSVAEDDMRTLATVPTGAADLIVANNAFIYLTTADTMAEALATFGRVLRPEGHALFFHANKHWRDPFTKDPVVHLLPRVLANPAKRVTGWKDSRDRVRLLWPWQLRRLLQRAGFERVRAGGFLAADFEVGSRGRRARFYATAARRSSSPEGNRPS